MTEDLRRLVNVESTKNLPHLGWFQSFIFWNQDMILLQLQVFVCSRTSWSCIIFQLKRNNSACQIQLITWAKRQSLFLYLPIVNLPYLSIRKTVNKNSFNKIIFLEATLIKWNISVYKWRSVHVFSKRSITHKQDSD